MNYEHRSQYTTVAMFATSLSADNNIRELLRILSSAAEYDELPVRHNEDKVSLRHCVHIFPSP